MFKTRFCYKKQKQKIKRITIKMHSYKILENCDNYLSMEYSLEKFHRSNQDTCLVHKPAVVEGQWVESGDLLADCSASVGGELSLGQNLLIGYMPWEGYNFEDAILISERLVYDDLYTSIHIEKYEVNIEETKLGMEEITREIPEVDPASLKNLNSLGLIKMGSWVQEGDILVGKVTPVNKKAQSNYQKLLYLILDKTVSPFRDSSLRAPKGIKAKVIGIQIFKNLNLYSKSGTTNAEIIDKFNTEKQVKKEAVNAQIALTSETGIQKGPRHQDKNSLNATDLNQTFINFYSSSYNKTKTKHKTTNKNLKKEKKSVRDKIIDIESFSYCQLPNLNTNRYLKRSPSLPRSVPANKKTINKNTNLLFGTKPQLPTKLPGLSPIKLLKSIASIQAKLYGTPNLKNSVYNSSISNKNLGLSSRRTAHNTAINSQELGFLKGVAVVDSNAAKQKMANSGRGAQSKNVSKTQHALTNTTQDQKSLLKGVSSIQIYLAERRRVQVGDKMAGRHGNKGIISEILPIEDLPFLPDGTPLDIVLNPLGVPSRMNVGQIYECLLGLAGKQLGENYKVFPFDEIYGAEASRSFVYSKLYKASVKTGKTWLFNPKLPGKIGIYDGRTGESFHQAITVGYAYILRLVHMVDDKMHCLTPDHDVLTTTGWVPINQITKDHKVATLVQGTGELVYQNPTDIHHYPNYEGFLYYIKNSNIDLLVTLNHRMYVKNGKKTGQSLQGYELIKASEIVGQHKKYLKNAKNNAPDYQFVLPPVYNDATQKEIPEKKVDMNAWLTYFGIWIAEGLTDTNVVSESAEQNLQKSGVYTVYVSQKKLSVISVIQDAIKALGYKFDIVHNKFCLNDKQLWTYLHSLSVGSVAWQQSCQLHAPRAYTQKFLPDWVWLLSELQAQKLLHAMCFDDGTYSSTSLNYYTASNRLADDVMRLALHAGWSANKYLHIKANTPDGTIDGQQMTNKNPVWRLSIIKEKNNPAVNQGHTAEQNVQKEEIIESYDGSVHCITIPNQIFYVRRNGLPVWTGNSRSTGPYSLVTQQPLRGRSKHGGQRLGEMEVWALEGYGAAFTLLEMLTIKSDDMSGRMTLWSNLILNKEISIGTPESFKVLICELQALCLDIGLYRITN